MKKGKQGYKIIDTGQPCFILSDNPVLFETPPVDYDGLTGPCIFPLTESRIYYGLKGNHYSSSLSIIKRENILLAIQAKQYFASTNKDFLQMVINAYRIMKPVRSSIDKMKNDLFEMINK